jgi:hypothetical protein
MIDAIRDFICTDQTGKAFWEEQMLSEVWLWCQINSW